MRYIGIEQSMLCDGIAMDIFYSKGNINVLVKFGDNKEYLFKGRNLSKILNSLNSFLTMEKKGAYQAGALDDLIRNFCYTGYDLRIFYDKKIKVYVIEKWKKSRVDKLEIEPEDFDKNGFESVIDCIVNYITSKLYCL